MVTVHQLHTLLEFYGDHSLSDTGPQDRFEELEKLGLLDRCADEVDGVDWFRATPLGMRVMRAASRAANAALGHEAPGPLCDHCGREMCCSCPVCDNDE